MKSKFSIQQVIEEAAKHEEIASLYRNIATSLKRLNPNIELVIADSGLGGNRPVVDVNHLSLNGVTPKQNASTKLDAMVQILKEAGKPMHKVQIEKTMKDIGHEITPETLNSYLSRNKELFKKHRRGVWKLAEQTSA